MEKRYWTHEEIGREVGGLVEASSALQDAVDGIEVLLSRSGEMVGEKGVSDEDLATLKAILERMDRECGRATDAAADSYVDYCEEQAAAIAAEYEERRA